MSQAARAERLLSLVATLLDAKDSLTLEQLGDLMPEYARGSFHARCRRLERDKSELVAIGLPLRYHHSDEESLAGYRLTKSDYYLPKGKRPGLAGESWRAILNAADAFPPTIDLAHGLLKLALVQGEPLPGPAHPLPGQRSPGDRLRGLLMLPPLVAARPGIARAVLAATLGIRKPEIEADLHTLSLVGKPPFGPGEMVDLAVESGGVTLYIGAGLDRAPRLNRPEAVALAELAMAPDLPLPAGQALLDAAKALLVPGAEPLQATLEAQANSAPPKEEAPMSATNPVPTQAPLALEGMCNHPEHKGDPAPATRKGHCHTCYQRDYARRGKDRLTLADKPPKLIRGPAKTLPTPAPWTPGDLTPDQRTAVIASLSQDERAAIARAYLETVRAEELAAAQARTSERIRATLGDLVSPPVPTPSAA